MLKRFILSAWERQLRLDYRIGFVYLGLCASVFSFPAFSSITLIHPPCEIAQHKYLEDDLSFKIHRYNRDAISLERLMTATRDYLNKEEVPFADIQIDGQPALVIKPAQGASNLNSFAFGIARVFNYRLVYNPYYLHANNTNGTTITRYDAQTQRWLGDIYLSGDAVAHLRIEQVLLHETIHMVVKQALIEGRVSFINGNVRTMIASDALSAHTSRLPAYNKNVTVDELAAAAYDTYYFVDNLDDRARYWRKKTGHPLTYDALADILSLRDYPTARERNSTLALLSNQFIELAEEMIASVDAHKISLLVEPALANKLVPIALINNSRVAWELFLPPTLMGKEVEYQSAIRQQLVDVKTYAQNLVEQSRRMDQVLDALAASNQELEVNAEVVIDNIIDRNEELYKIYRKPLKRN